MGVRRAPRYLVISWGGRPAAPLAAEAAWLARRGAAAAAVEGEVKETPFRPPQPSPPPPGPRRQPRAVCRACPHGAARRPLQPAPQRPRAPTAPPPPGWAASIRRRGPERQTPRALRSGSCAGSPRREGAGNGGCNAAGAARGGGAKAPRALVTGAGRLARVRARERLGAAAHPAGHVRSPTPSPGGGSQTLQPAPG